jgi:ABC-type dipeptide/oligopeptide/nickel transport system permease component
MRAYIIRRLLLLAPTLLAVTVAVFMTVRIIPGSAIDQMIAEMMNGGGDTDVATMRVYLRHQLGLDQPVHIQYLRWLGLAKQDDGRYHGVLQGDLGHSLWE